MPPAANDNEVGEITYRITWVTGGFMFALSIVFDAIQILLNFTVVLAIGTYMVDFLYIIIYPVWLYILGVPLIGGRQSGLKMASAFGGVVLELVPVFNALPAMTASVLGIIIASRMEDRMKYAARKEVPAARPARFLPKTAKVPRAANDDEPYIREAA